tara:strand:+ start:183 stop:389 length:207 start_codon:yes stop_codon:yes gene_type:complete
MKQSVTVNGQTHQVSKNETGQSLLEHFQQNPKHVIIEHNTKIIKGCEWETPISEGDIIEIIQFMGGGA